jgi:hypothetical protein
MAAISFAILGKNNEPLYVREFLDHPQGSRRVSDDDLFGLSHCADSGKYQSQDAETPFATTTAERRKPGAFGRLECSIQQQFILHSAVDRFEELSGPSGYGWRSPGVTGTEAMFVGLLEPVENTRVYGTYDRRAKSIRFGAAAESPGHCLSVSRLLTPSTPIALRVDHRLHDNNADSLLAGGG